MPPVRFRHCLAALLAILAPDGTAVASGGGEGGGGSGGAAGGPALVPMVAMDVPIVDGDRSDGRLLMTLVLRATDAAAAVRLTGDMPRLREASVAAASEFARLHASPFVAVDAGLLASDMTQALQARDPGIAQVLLVEVAARRS